MADVYRDRYESAKKVLLVTNNGDLNITYRELGAIFPKYMKSDLDIMLAKEEISKDHYTYILNLIAELRCIANIRNPRWLEKYETSSL